MLLRLPNLSNQLNLLDQLDQWKHHFGVWSYACQYNSQCRKPAWLSWRMGWGTTYRQHRQVYRKVYQ